MLALISFTLLGIWTSILGVANHSEQFQSSGKEMNLESLPVTKSDGALGRGVALVDAVIQEPQAKVSEAFLNLWKEIIEGH